MAGAHQDSKASAEQSTEQSARALEHSGHLPQEAVPDGFSPNAADYSAAPPPESFHESAPSYEEAVASPAISSTAAVPNVDAPFEFPKTPSSTAPPPPHSSGASSGTQRPIAFPQVRPDSKSPFISAYAPVLLRHGVTDETWRSFLATISAFLTATASDRAVRHAADMAQELGKAPKDFGKNVASHAKSIGKDITTMAKRGNIIGAAMGVVVGAISLPVSAALGATGTVLSLPGSAIEAISKRPRTPLQRAADYAAVANEKWLHARGLHAQLVDTPQLAQLLGLSGDELLNMARETKEIEAAGQLAALEPHIASLELQQQGPPLHLDTQSIWLVLTPWEARIDHLIRQI